ncbi:DUF2268 domain-containing protein [Tengunoibacter tsumagoiensis]|uniref:DUF2268 domain-containing protein n=1 Tax=Tengunoibacter tsumagoiensis TaxID=2014871 RepID=A0A402A1H6_9CHLR|nr:DUF2268 domain-containing putative Zn-dependent protease [Tengunoibacter tsumagoiensis]GCE12899.1 hypothetical protein KTT_27580 [Tengunoibacter tsumagoiensis]
MKLQIIDAESIYQRLLNSASAQESEALYCQELLAPFEGMMRIYGGNDPLAMAKMWSFYTPEDFDGEQRPFIEDMLQRLSDNGVWQRSATALERGVSAFAPYADQIALDTINCALVLTKHTGINTLGRGYAGFGGFPGYLIVTLSLVDDYTIPRVGPALVHELNHNVRFKIVPFLPMSITVADYIIAEGLAESFAAELFGHDLVGYMVTDFDEEEIATAKRVIGGNLDVSGFNAVRSYIFAVRSYIFGDTIAASSGLPKVGLPDFAGYAIGYRVVQHYLQRTGRSVVDATFLPSQEIIEESDFFA